VIAGPREERLNVLAELVRLGTVERAAQDRGDHTGAAAANERMREVVSLLGFDPLEYEPGRDAAALVINRRVRRMLDAMPATTTELGKVAGSGASRRDRLVHRPRAAAVPGDPRDPQEPLVIADLAGLAFALLICVAVWSELGRRK
jgi:hypothetical protein